MKCPFCGFGDTRVIESRPTDEGASIRRRRECPSCGGRFTTYERMETMPLYVIKRDGGREPFDRQKVLRGMVIACQKRPVPVALLEEATSRIETELRNQLESEVSSRAIGQMVMDELRRIDPVAYIRFASVYMQFDLRRFQEELDAIIKEYEST
ncbi:MAG: transcriptional repressor NrdR [Firmicutes bacterium]|jgi:transcriptional repressor NrdR|nr:transcriptional repressor NrdR [Bacillota bacterium]